MESGEKFTPEEIEDIWRCFLTTGGYPESLGAPWYTGRRFRSLFLRMPADPRCRICLYPFKGIGGAVMRHFFGIVPSHLNPLVCNHCERFAEEYHGGAEVEATVLFADVRGSTSLGESMPPAVYSRLIHRFYRSVTNVLYHSGGLVEKIIGDAVTGFYVPGFAGPQHPRVAVEAAEAILKATGHGSPGGPWIPVGIGVHTGPAYVGAINTSEGVTDIAILGDTANIGARLASLAGMGEIYASQATATAAGLDPNGVQISSQALKGRAEPVEVWVLKPEVAPSLS